MSPYYQYSYTSVEPIIALITEELKSYIDTGAIDSSIWSIYVSKCLRKLGKGMLQIQPLVLEICNYEARLPDNFHSVREAWLCTNVSKSYKLPGTDYQEIIVGSTSTLLDSAYSYCTPCASCAPDVIKAVYKTTHEAFAYYSKQYLLRPGNVHSKQQCSENCENLQSQATDTFDIIGNKLRTNFVEGNIYLLYYSTEVDDSGYQLIPDNFRIQEYIEAFIKQKVFEQLSNQVVDETYNQIQQKAQYYKQVADEAYIIADTEQKKQTTHQKIDRIKSTRMRFNKYRIN